MTIIDRPTTLRRSTTRIPTGSPAVPTPLGGRYVSGGSEQPRVEGSYVSTGSLSAPATRGTYVTTSGVHQVSGGTYTYTA